MQANPESTFADGALHFCGSSVLASPSISDQLRREAEIENIIN